MRSTISIKHSSKDESAIGYYDKVGRGGKQSAVNSEK